MLLTCIFTTVYKQNEQVGELIMINMNQVKGGKALVDKVANAVAKSDVTTVDSMGSNAPADDKIMSEAAMNICMNAVEAELTRQVEDTMTLTDTAVTEFTVTYTPTVDKLVMNVNGLVYVEGKHLTVDRDARKVTWTYTASNGGFDLTNALAGSVKLVYQTTKYDLMLPGTANQTITLTYTEPPVIDSELGVKKSAPVVKTSTDVDQHFMVVRNTMWTATVAGAEGYNPGTLSASSGTVTGNTAISAETATLSGFTVTIKADKKLLYEEYEFFDEYQYIVFSVSYTNASGSIVDTGRLKNTGNEVNTFIVKPNTEVTIAARPTNIGKYRLHLYEGNKYIGTFPAQSPAGPLAPITIIKNTTFEFKVERN